MLHGVSNHAPPPSVPQVLKRPHLLLVTLLLVNAAAMEALPIFLDRLVSPTIAIILSVTAVLFFGAGPLSHIRHANSGA